MIDAPPAMPTPAELAAYTAMPAPTQVVTHAVGAPMTDLQAHNLWASLGVLAFFIGLRAVFWLVKSGWWRWCVRMLVFFAVWGVCTVLFGTVGFYASAGIMLAVMNWPKLARWNEEREARELAARIRGERVDRVLRVFEERING